jgi:Xaa-Pro aminopeptidase
MKARVLPRIIGPALAALLVFPAAPPGAESQAREFAEREWQVKEEKMRQHLLPLMRRHDIDMWIIMSRENNVDPIVELFGGYGITGWYGHRNAYIFYDPGPEAELEAVVYGTHLSQHLTPFFQKIVNYGEEGLSGYLYDHVVQRAPHRIAINRSRTVSMADGLSAELHDYLVEAVGREFAERFVSAEPLIIDFVSTRTAAELEIAREASWITWNILRRAFSNEVISPGETTLMDVHWWIVDEWRSQHLDFNFPPSLSIQRRGLEGELYDYTDAVIMPGDLIHVDFGIRLSGIVTDQQKMIYVLRPGEKEAPAGLQRAFARSVRMHDIIAEELKVGVPGHLVKQASERRGNEEGIENLVYSHTQGNWVHDAGAWAIHDWPERYGQRAREPVRPTELWSIEFATWTEVPEWDGQRVRMAREEDAWIDEDGGVRPLAGPQTELWLIRTEEGRK